MYDSVPVTDLINKMFTSVKQDGSVIIFKNDDEEYRSSDNTFNHDAFMDATGYND